VFGNGRTPKKWFEKMIGERNFDGKIEEKREKDSV
jgi:hypothetical protein